MGCKKIRISINKDLAITNLVGVNINKEFMPSVANIVGTNLTNYKIIKKNQFVYNNMQVARDRTIRIVRYADETPSIMSPAYKIFQVIDKNTLNAEFLMLYFLRPEFDRLCWFYTDSSIRGSLDWVKFCSLEVPVLPINIQEKIVNIYNFINERIYLKNKINKNLEQLMKCIFEDWFVNFNYNEDISFKSSELGEIPSNWNVKKLSDVLITLESGKRPKGGISDIEDGIPSIGAENILGLGKFNYSKNKLISHEFFSTLKKGVIQDKDVLLYKDGAQLGRKSLFMKGFPFDICCINEHVFRLQTNDEINQFYLYLWLDQEVMTNEIINLNSNSAQPGINQNDVKSLPILVPELKIISKFNKIISPMMNQIFDNALEINKLTKLRDTLLPKLMSGEIDVSKINCDLKIIIRKIYIKSSKLFLWRYLSENKNYIKNTKSNETLLKSRTIYQINKFLAKFNARYRYYRQ